MHTMTWNLYTMKTPGYQLVSQLGRHLPTNSLTVVLLSFFIQDVYTKSVVISFHSMRQISAILIQSSLFPIITTYFLVK